MTGIHSKALSIYLLLMFLHEVFILRFYMMLTLVASGSNNREYRESFLNTPTAGLSIFQATKGKSNFPIGCQWILLGCLKLLRSMVQSEAY